MKWKWIKKLTLIMLFVSLIGGSLYLNTSTSQASSSKEGTVEAYVLNVRSGPSLEHTISGKLQHGQKVSILSTNGNWLKILFDGKEAFVHKEYIRINSTEIITKGTAVITASSLIVRSAPSTSSSVLGGLKNGDIVSVIEQVGEWVTIKYGNRSAYIHSDYVKPNNSDLPNQSLNELMTTSVDVLNIRDAEGLASNVVGKLSKGETVTIVEKNEQWGAFVKDGTKYYVYLPYMVKATNSPNETWLNGKITASKLNIRENPNTQSTIIGSLLNGDTITYKLHNSQWGIVQTNQNKTGYIHLDYVEKTKTPIDVVSKNAKVNVDVLNVRSGPSTNYSIVGKAKKGEIYQTLFEDKEWVKISYNNSTAYLFKQHISLVNEPPTSNSSSGPIEDNNNQKISIAYVNASTLNVRKEPTTDSIIIGKLPNQTKVEVVNTDNGWSKIKFENDYAFVSSNYLVNHKSDVGSDTKQTESYVVTATVLNVRKGPSTQQEKIGQIKQGDIVSVEEIYNGWMKINYNNQIGYVSALYMSKNDNGKTPTTNSLKGKTVVLDAGHGGKDAGAIGNGIYEKNLALDVTNRIKRKLESAGAKVIMTRTNDSYLTLSQRTSISANSKGDIFVSIHANSSDISSVTGVETFYYGAGDSHRRQESLSLAQKIQQSLATATKSRNRGVRTQNFQVIQHNVLPSVLVEIGFISNSYEASLLKTDAYKEKVSQSIFEGIKEHLIK